LKRLVVFIVLQAKICKSSLALFPSGGVKKPRHSSGYVCVFCLASRKNSGVHFFTHPDLENYIKLRRFCEKAGLVDLSQIFWACPLLLPPLAEGAAAGVGSSALMAPWGAGLYRCAGPAPQGAIPLLPLTRAPQGRGDWGG